MLTNDAPGVQMILYSLKCGAAHDFDSWFRSSDAFDAMKSASQIACPICGNTEILKTLMAPAIRPARKTDARSVSTDPVPSGPLSKPASLVEEAFAAMRRRVEENSDYVGLNFAAEARRMHDGATPARAIYGEAKPEDARKLLEDGVPVAPLPFMPARKIN